MCIRDSLCSPCFVGRARRADLPREFRSDRRAVVLVHSGGGHSVQLAVGMGSFIRFRIRSIPDS
eukprot:12442080-Alexandrium_andersonii.AAC.1